LLGAPADGVRLVVVPLDAEGGAAIDAPRPVEVGWRTQVEGGADLGGDVAAEVANLGDVGAVDDHGLDERVLGDAPGHGYRHAAHAGHVAALAVLGGTS